MRKSIVIATAMAMLAMGGTAMAGDNTTVAVSASVTGTCKFDSGGSVSFALDPATGGDVSGTIVQPEFWCTKGASYTISDDNGLNASGTTHQLKHASLSEYIPYTFDYTATGTGAGKGSLITMNIASQVAGADYINASSGSYNDTVTLTITP